MGQKGFANLVLIGGIIILLGLGGYFAWSRESSDSVKSPSLFSGCQEKVGSSYRNIVSAKIEKLNQSYVLTLDCKGGSIYIQDPNNLDQYIGFPVSVTYQYVSFLNTNIRCIQAPCNPMTETRVRIVSVSKSDTSVK